MTENQAPEAVETPVVAQTEAKGTKELKELLDLILTGVEIGVKVSADGKVTLEDVGTFLLLLPKLEPAISGIKELPGELSDLSADEAGELVAHIMTSLVVDDVKAKAVVEQSFKVLLAVYALVKAIKG